MSGGQTGVDRAALDAAMDTGLAVGGWCPRGRRAEDGRIDDRYPLHQTPTSDYSERTTLNVRDSDGTLVIASRELAAGTAFTVEEANRLGRPHFMADPSLGDVDAVRSWLLRQGIRTLNIVGPREAQGTRPGEGEEEGIYAAAYAFIRALLSGL